MAITNRAARGDIHSASYTPDVVGPGSYLKVDRKQTIHGFAPFSSTVERPGPLVSSAPTPGPGAYVTALENTCGRTVFAPNGVAPGAGAAFASRVARMPTEYKVKQQEKVPGPGMYSLRDDWNAQRETLQLQSSQPPQKRAPQIRSIGPPSIPAPDQSFGYEETHEGELRMQKPPTGGYTGTSGHRSVGPGEYEPTRATAITKAAPIGSSFGNSRVSRSVFSENKEVPGPGAYARDDVESRARPSAALPECAATMWRVAPWGRAAAASACARPLTIS